MLEIKYELKVSYYINVKNKHVDAVRSINLLS